MRQIRWLSSTDRKHWHNQCLDLRESLIQKDKDDRVMEKWVNFLQGYAANILENFPKNEKLYAKVKTSGGTEVRESLCCLLL